jgi:hydroxyquinol 1,2-dioxygenase
MKNLDELSITDAVLQSHAGTPDSRTKELVDSVVTHLHAFAHEVSLTENEWLAAIRFLTAVGHKTDDRRQEFILLSDTLGLSSLVTAMSNRKPAECTESTVLDPFSLTDAPALPNGGDVAQGAPGELCFVSGSVRGVHGEPVAGARIEVWQADEDGLYDVQYEDLDAPRARAVLLSEPDGSFEFRTIVPRPYPVPYDGPVGEMLKTLGRRPVRPAHLHFMISNRSSRKSFARTILICGRTQSSACALRWSANGPGIPPASRRTAASGKPRLQRSRSTSCSRRFAFDAYLVSVRSNPVASPSGNSDAPKVANRSRLIQTVLLVLRLSIFNLQLILEHLLMAQGLRTLVISMAVVAAFASSVAQATPYRCDPNDPNYDYDNCQHSSPSRQ